MGVFEDIKRGLEEAIAFEKGERSARVTRLSDKPETDNDEKDHSAHTE